MNLGYQLDMLWGELLIRTTVSTPAEARTFGWTKKDALLRQKKLVEAARNQFYNGRMTPHEHEKWIAFFVRQKKRRVAHQMVHQSKRRRRVRR